MVQNTESSIERVFLSFHLLLLIYMMILLYCLTYKFCSCKYTNFYFLVS
jgi:hypothetical protein